MSDIGQDDVVSAMTSNQHSVSWKVKSGGGKGSHIKLVWNEDDSESKRVVIVPQEDPIPKGTLSDIAEQAGANDFQEWKRWIKRYR